MPSVLVSVFILQLVIHLVNTVGASTINNILWSIYSRLPTPTSKAATEQRKLQARFLQIRKELNATSSQDEFAKWAKLRRQHDKLLDQLEKQKASLDSTRAIFDKVVIALRWLGTNGLRTIMSFWFQKQPMFWIPKGLVPYYAEWLLSFPRAPVGSISIQSWQLACGAAILLVSDAISAIVVLVMQASKRPAEKGKREPMKMTGEKSMGEKATGEKSTGEKSTAEKAEGTKKEL